MPVAGDPEPRHLAALSTEDGRDQSVDRSSAAADRLPGGVGGRPAAVGSGNRESGLGSRTVGSHPCRMFPKPGVTP
jgi:hypothetical protein